MFIESLGLICGPWVRLLNYLNQQWVSLPLDEANERLRIEHGAFDS